MSLSLRASRAARGIASRRRLVPLLVAVLAACSPDQVVGSADLPNDILDPAAVKTPAGAMAAYRGALVQLDAAFGGYQPYVVHFGHPNGSFIATTGLLSDELQAGDLGGPLGTSSQYERVDARTLPEYTDPSTEPDATYRTTYSELQVVRAQARQAIGLLRTYAPDTSPALTGHLYAVLGYTEVMLAELFCSGIPLTTVDFDGDYTLAPPSTTEEVLQHAVALFDTALTLAADSARVMNLARVGKGRALLDLDRYAEAAQAVADVPDDFRYLENYYDQVTTTPDAFANFRYRPAGFAWFATVSNGEGGTGLDYIASGDPRTAAVPDGGTNTYGVTLYVPAKYSASGDTPIVLADAIEAHLIRAEAALNANDPSWLATLNALRTTCTDAASCPDPAPPGLGGVAGLPPLSDPGTRDARVDLLFRERAAWLFLTGHRQGDMRRLIRQYGRAPSAVYPTGSYPGGTGAYGTDVTAPIPASERAFNPKFTGCVSRGA
ncbi:MAG: hypothetical protein IRY91_00260 [Gemmatimonadaceae bacterium]|nr:hypothetical protein [Gemmatimonadaceae bacterium]